MRVLLLGGGGREHALAWKMSQSPKLDQLFIAPGNGGTSELGTNVPIKETDFEAIKELILREGIHLVVVGPEAPLVAGIRDFMEADESLKDVKVLGSGKAGAELEGSKAFAKRFMEKVDIPTARYAEFGAEELDQAKAFLDEMKPPYVLKADGLAAGKGVLILEDRAEAESSLEDFLIKGKFGEASERVVIEEYLHGIELSVFVLTDGNNYVILPEAKDYKRIGEGDTGLNTGGMGSISPVPFADATFMQRVEDRIVKPTIQGLKNEAIPYNGFVFIGLMNVDGDPYVIEYNVRMGDPETETVMRRIDGDLLEALWLTADNKTAEVSLGVSDDHSACVMLVSGGYPEGYEKGKLMTIESVEDEQVVMFHAGTKRDEEGLKTSGGRVLAISANASNREEALNKAYSVVKKVDFERMNYRSDIGFDL